MTTREKLELMEEMRLKNDIDFAEIKRQRRREAVEDIWQDSKGVFIAAGIGILLGQIVLWIAG